MIQKSENFLNEKNIQTSKRESAFKGIASTYSIEILNSFNPELQLKDAEFAIENKVIIHCLNHSHKKET